ncbi:MAG TPA: GAF domain-containing protein [Devosia sp.]|nr:GAF domain-containing protein [Devosia sp.]
MRLDEAWPHFMAVVAEASTPKPVFEALLEIVNGHVGNRLMTAQAFEVPAGRQRRIYSENEAAYPVGGFKPIQGGRWTDTILDRREIFSSVSIEDMAEVFFDWKLIQSLGCESILNLPVVVAGEVIGTLNLLNRAGYYTAERVAAARDVLPFATMAFLVAEIAERG